MTRALTKPPPMKTHGVDMEQWVPPERHAFSPFIEYESSDEPWAAYCGLGEYELVVAGLYDIRTYGNALVGYTTIDPSRVDKMKIKVPRDRHFHNFSVETFNSRGEREFRKPTHSGIRAGTFEGHSVWLVDSVHQAKSLLGTDKVLTLNQVGEYVRAKYPTSKPSHWKRATIDRRPENVRSELDIQVDRELA